MKFTYVIILFVFFGFASFVSPVLGAEDVTIYLFGRDDCAHCSDEKAFLDVYVKEQDSVTYEYLNVTKEREAKELYEQILEKHTIPHITPVTVIGDSVIQGFDSDETTGVHIVSAVELAREGGARTLEEHILYAEKQSAYVKGSGCDENGDECDSITNPNMLMFNLPVIGVVDLKSFSLFSLSAVLGTIDGFNPCAMWVLITFLLLLSQIGDLRKMIMVAGVFILAETIMYNLILNVWFTTWDFVGLDAIVTPLVGLLALGGGTFFLYRYWKNRNSALMCDISDLESQSKTVSKIKDLISKPVTIITVLGIIAIAFSVNIIEFACSIGIPQAFTKILEMNNLDFLARQTYIMVYTIGYMIDDLVVFGLAIWGFSKLESHGHKYAQYSLLIGGILMLVLGILLITVPDALVL